MTYLIPLTVAFARFGRRHAEPLQFLIEARDALQAATPETCADVTEAHNAAAELTKYLAAR